MLNLFKIEWLKIKTYKTFWLLYLSFMVFTPLFVIFVAYKFMNSKYSNFEEMTLKALAGAPFVFPKVWHSATYFSGSNIIHSPNNNYFFPFNHFLKG